MKAAPKTYQDQKVIPSVAGDGGSSNAATVLIDSII